MLTVNQLKIELALNETALQDAYNAQDLAAMHSLLTQRINLKNMLIEALEALIAA